MQYGGVLYAVVAITFRVKFPADETRHLKLSGCFRFLINPKAILWTRVLEAVSVSELQHSRSRRLIL